MRSACDPVTDDQWAAMKAEVLRRKRASLELYGYHPDRIKTLMLQAEWQVMEDIAQMQSSLPNWLTPRRQRILAEIR